MNHIVKLGRKYAIYLPKNIVSSLNLKEGDKLILKVEGEQIVLKPLRFLRKRPAWAKTTIEEFERESEELLGETLK